MILLQLRHICYMWCEVVIWWICVPYEMIDLWAYMGTTFNPFVRVVTRSCLRARVSQVVTPFMWFVCKLLVVLLGVVHLASCYVGLCSHFFCRWSVVEVACLSGNVVAPTYVDWEYPMYADWEYVLHGKHLYNLSTRVEWGLSKHERCEWLDKAPQG